jgi:hypothetical protein
MDCGSEEFRQSSVLETRILIILGYEIIETIESARKKRDWKVFLGELHVATGSARARLRMKRM